MVKIPDTPLAAPVRAERIVPPPMTESPLANFFTSVGKKMEQWVREQDHDALVEAQNIYAKDMESWAAKAEAVRTGEAATGFTKDFSAEHGRVVDNILQNTRLSSDGQKAFQNWAKGRESHGVGRAARYEHAQMRLHGQDMHNERVQGIFEHVGQDPNDYPDAVRQLEEAYALAVGQGIYRKGEARVRFNEARDKLQAETFENLYAVDRGRAMKSMQALGLSKSQQARAQKRYQADLRADAAAARAANADKVRLLSGQVEDVDYLASQTGDVGALRQLAANLGALGEDKTADKLARRADLYENNAAAIKESRELPLPDLAKEIAGMGVKLEGAADAADAAGHQKLSEELKLRTAIFEERRKALAADPAGAVAVQAERALPDGAADDARLRSEARLAAQENNGVPHGLRKVLTGEEAARLNRAWQDGDLAARLGLVEHINSYGPYAAKAAAETGLSPAEQLLAMQARRDPRAAGGNLAAVIAAAAARPEDLPKLEKADALAREAAESSQVVKAAKAASALMPSLPDLATAARNYEDTLARLVRLKGGDTAKAVSLLDGRLQSLEDGNNFALIYDPKNVEGKNLELGLRAAMDGPALEELAAGRSFADDFEREDWLAHMRRSGVWLNAPDGEGYMLFDPVAQAPAMDRQGNVLRVTDKDASGVVWRRRIEGREQQGKAK